MSTVPSLFTEVCFFAADKHQIKPRKNEKATPYINHPLEVAKYLAIGGGVTSTEILSAAVLHDVLEDTGVSYEELHLLFGKQIADIVLEVTDDKKLSKKERKQKQVEKMKNASLGAKTVKIGDKISNVKSCFEDPPKSWGKNEIVGYTVWSKKVVDVCRDANLGLAEVFDKLFDPVFEKYGLKNMDVDNELEKYYNSL
jgi:guanosine-3',5'-bis(diphosphate) 3'-pyrophosphohydrolase